MASKQYFPTVGQIEFEGLESKNPMAFRYYDPEDIFIAHIAAMDVMARALLIAADILDNSPYEKMLAERYASYDSGEGRLFEEGKLTLEQVADYARRHEPVQRSGKQELFEAIVNM